MTKSSQEKRTKLQSKGKALNASTTSVAAICAFAIVPYADFMILSARDEGMFPGWRVHLFSAWLGTVCFVVALFCLEALVQESKIMAFRSTIRWYPFVVLTGIANIFNIHTLIVIAVAAAYAIWMWRRGKRILPIKP